MDMRFEVTITGTMPMFMHGRDISFEESVKKWRSASENKGAKDQYSAGDDRSPAWLWLGYVHRDIHGQIAIPQEMVMSTLRGAGAKVQCKGKETYKKQTQSALMFDEAAFPIHVIGGDTVDLSQNWNMLLRMGDNFEFHEEYARDNGFKLDVRPVKVGQGQHIRVRPMFPEWEIVGTLTVMDPVMFGITEDILQRIFDEAGFKLGFGDWRPAATKSGPYGRFETKLRRLA